MSSAQRHDTQRSRLIRRVVRRPGRSGTAMRLFVVALAVDGGGLAHAAEPSQDSERARFEDWVERAATRVHGEVSMLTEIELDGTPGSELVARLCQDDGWAETVLVESGAHRWSVAHPSWGHTRVCDPRRGASSWVAEDELRLIDWGPGHGEERRLAIIDSELVVLSEWHADSLEITEARWDLASERRDDADGRVVAVRQGNRVAPESGPVFVLDGEAGFHGRDDADLTAVAERRADGHVLLRVSLADDEPRLGPDGDGIDVWWQRGESDELAGVRVRSDATGRLRVGGVRMRGEPQVSGEVHAFELVLPWTIEAAEPFAKPLTIVVRDTDDDATTHLATSQFEETVHTLGLLRWVPGGGDFQPIGQRIADVSTFDALPVPPRE